MRLVPFLPEQLLGSFAGPFHCFQILPHGFHGERVRSLPSGQMVDLPLLCLWGDPLAAVFQIPGRCVLQDQGTVPGYGVTRTVPAFPASLYIEIRKFTL